MKNDNISAKNQPASLSAKIAFWILLGPFVIVLWPFRRGLTTLHHSFSSYICGRVLRDDDRIYSIRFVHYGDSIYLHPMIWGSVILYFLAQPNLLGPSWTLLIWFIMLVVCYIAIMYNFDVVRTSMLGVFVLAVFGAAYFATIEFAFNPLRALLLHLESIDAGVTPGFFIASAYVFTGLIVCDVAWSWLFRRVEIDESYVYEHQFLRTSTREPIFARGLRRETKDLLELLLLGAGDIQHRTRNGVKRFSNVPFASLWVGRAIDGLLDYRRSGQVQLERKLQGRGDKSDQARPQDAFRDMEDELDDWDDGDPSEGDGLGDEDGASDGA